MSWPANPTNGQQVTINGVLYEYDSTPGVWNRVGSGASSVAVDSFTTANLTVTNQAHLGDIGDVIITGGGANYSLTTDGNGNLSWTAIGGAVVPGGANTQVQYNTNGEFDGSANFTFDDTTNTLTATNFSGNGSGLANITSANIVGTVANANHAQYANYSNFAGETVNANYASYSNIANRAGTVTATSQPNITSVGTLSTLAVSGNISAGNINATIFGPYNGVIGATTPNLATFTNVTLTGNANITANVSAGNINATNLVVANRVTGTLTTPAQPNITSLGTLSSLSINGQITGHLIPSEDQAFDIGSPNSRWRTLYISANTIDLGGTTLSSSNGNITTNGNLTGDNVSIVGQFITSVATGKPPLVVYSNTVVANLNASLLNGATATASNVANSIVARDTNRNFSANIIQARLFGQSNTAATVITNAQPNITSVGTLTALGVSGNLTGNVGNFAGNVTANFFVGNGSQLTGLPGNALTGTLSSGVLGNSNLNIGNTSITLNRAAGQLSLEGVSIDGSAGSANTAGTVTTNAQPNITSVGSLTGLTINGNLIVTGTTQYANVTTFNIKDPVIEMGGNPNGAPLSGNDGKDRGSLLHYFTDDAVDAFMGWDNSNSEFIFGSNVSMTSDVVTVNSYGNIRANYFIGNISGNSSSAVTAGTVTTNAQPNITSVGTLSGLSVSTGSVSNSTPASFTQTWNNASAVFTGIKENIVDTNSAGESLLIDLQVGGTSKFNVTKLGLVTANQYTGSGANLTNLPAANLVGEVPNANFALYTGVSQTVSNAYQPNITRVGNLTTLVVNSGAELTSSNPVKINQTWNNANRFFTMLEANVTDDASIVDSKLIDMMVNTVSVFSVEKNGNVSAPNFIGNLIGNFSGNVNAPGSNRQVIYNDDGTLGTSSDLTFNEATGTLSVKLANIITGPVILNTPVYFTQTWNNSSVTFTHLRANITDNFSNINSVLLDLQVNGSTKFKVDKSGTVTGTSYTGSGANLTNLPAANITGLIANSNYASYSGNATLASTANTVINSAQPNITSVGNLISLRANTGTLTANTPYTFLQNWGNGDEVFTGIRQNITDTASDPTSLLLDLQVSGSSTFSVDKSGVVIANVLIGEGGNLSNLQASNLVGEVPNANFAVYSTYANITENSNVANTVSTNAQPNITSVGTLTGLSIGSGAITSDRPLSLVQTWQNGAVTFNTISASITDTTSSANSTLIDMKVGGNSKFKVSKTGNVTGNYFFGDGSQLTNLPGASGANFANYSGNVTVNSQPNITSVGNLTSLTVVGNITAGNANLGDIVNANLFVGSGANLTNLPAANLVGQVPNAEVAGTVTTNAQPNITSVGTLSNVITNGNVFIQQTELSNSNKVAFRSAVDNAGAATITLGSPSALTLGQYNVANKLKSGDRLIITGATGDSTSLNTTYTITTVVLTPSTSVILTVTPDVITKAGGSANVTSITAVALRKTIESSTSNITGYFDVVNVVSLTASNLAATTVTANVQSNITSVGNLTSLTVTGNISSGNANLGNLAEANFFSGNGSSLFGIPAGNITGTVANATYALSANTANSATTAGSATTATTAGSATTAGTVTTAAQGNITSVGNLTSLIVTGNISSGNASLGNLAKANFFSGNGSLLTGVIASVANTVSTNAQPNITSLGNLTKLNVTSPVLTSSQPISFNQTWSNTSIEFTSLELKVTKTGALAGSLLINALVGAESQFSVSDAGDLKTNNANLGNLATANYIGGTLTTAAQPNITSIGNLTSLIVSGNANISNVYGAVFGPVQGIIGGSKANSATFTDVTINGNLVLTSGSNLGNFATANYFGGNGAYLQSINGANVTTVTSSTNAAALLQETSSANTVYPTFTTSSSNGNSSAVINANISANLNNASIKATTFIGNVSGGNLVSGNFFAGTLTTAAQPNITSIGTLGNLTVTSNISSNNANITGTAIITNLYTNTSREKINVSAVAYTANTNFDFTNGTVFYTTAGASATVTPDFINVPTGVGAVTIFVLMILQGATAYGIGVSGVKIGGVSQTVKWLGGITPSTFTSSQLETYTFTLIRPTDSTWTVLAQQGLYN